MPTPRKGETHDDFIARCIPIVINDNTASDSKQGYAICQSMWDNKDKAVMNKPVFLKATASDPVPSDSETRSQFMARCVPNVMASGLCRTDAEANAHCSAVWEEEATENPAVEDEPQRAYSLLDVKSVSTELRKIEGMATTPTTDRMGDIVEPLGISYKNPLPLLWQHNHDQPIGEVKFGKASENGVPFVAQIADPEKTSSPTLRNRLLEAWDSVKMGLVKGVSIGFIPKEYNFMKGGGLRIEKSEVYELSLVTIPANAEATISMIKKLDRKAAAPGSTLDDQFVTCPMCDGAGKLDGNTCPECGGTGMIRDTTPMTESQKPATGRKIVTINVPATRAVSTTSTAKGKIMPRTIAEQVSAYEAKRAANAARMQAIIAVSDEKGSTLDQPQQEEFDTLDGENKTIDDHLVRLKRLDVINKQSLITLDAKAEEKRVGDGGEWTPKTQLPIAKVKANVPPGTGFVRLAMALAAGKGDLYRSIRFAKESTKFGGWDNTPEVLNILDQCDDLPGMMQKAAVGAGTTTDATWASPLVQYQILASEYVALLRPATIIGRIPGLRMVPFNVKIPVANSGTTVGWVGENAPKPVSQMSFSSITMLWAKAAGIVIITQELARFSNPAAESLVRADLIAQMAQFLDKAFVDPSAAAVPNVSPASITNGVSAIPASGTNFAAFQTDTKALFQTFLNANLSAADGVWIGTQRQALSFSMMLNALGQPLFPGMTGNGGTLMGYPYIASENIPASGGSPDSGSPLIFAKASEIMMADDGQTVIDASNQASINMDSAPDSPPTGTTTLVSLWQMNLTGIRAERWINWQKRRPACVSYISGAFYG